MGEVERGEISGPQGWVRVLLAPICLAECGSACVYFSVSMNVRLLPLHLCWGYGGEEGMGKGFPI